MAGPPVRVLIVDGDRDLLHSASTLVESMGHVARAASTGAEGLRQIPAFEPDLVLLDVEMPVVGGIAVAQRIHDSGLDNEPALAAMASLATADLQAQCAEAGFDHYLVKPVDIAALDQLIRIARPHAGPSSDFLVLQARHKEAVYAFTCSQLDFCELMLDLAGRSRKEADRDRQLQKVERSLQNVAAWLEKQSHMPKRQWHAIRSQFAVLKYRLSAMKD